MGYDQWEFQDPKMEVLPYFVGISPYIALIYGRYLQFRILKFPLMCLNLGCSWAFDVMYQWDFMVTYNGDGMGYNLHLRGCPVALLVSPTLTSEYNDKFHWF